jgi:hypothetical protein
MTQNTPAPEQRSSEKAKSSEKTYRISISNGILEHCPDMLDSVWLFIWYIDKTTAEKNGEGSVLGGIPIRDSRAASALRVPVKTSRRWRLHLEKKGYIRTVRTPYGHVITLLKSKKWNRGPVLVSEASDPAKRDLPNGEISPKENSRSGQSEFPKRALRIPVSGTENSRNGKYKEDNAVDFTKQDRDIAVEAAAGTAATARPQLDIKTERHPEAWGAVGLQPCGSPKFNLAWEQAWRDRTSDESLSDAMERCDQGCQADDIPVPKRFFDRKKELYRQEHPEEFLTKAQQREKHNKEVLDKAFRDFACDAEESEPISRRPGIRGVREELMR